MSLNQTYNELPIAKYKEEILTAVNNYTFTIVSAETGSGKSTQIPKYLSEVYRSVVVTEPRIMAAKTLARRVAEEMDVTLGQEVGYSTSMDKCYSPNTKILYCTDGIQLVKSIFEEDHSKERVLIIDEAHEWNLNIEVLVAWCKYMYKKWNTKVVIMSATIETEKLSEYFGENVTVINVPGNLYEVSVEERNEVSLIDTVIEKINEGKNVLVFAPGKKEINDIISKISYKGATVLPLHGEMDWDDQKKCFWHYSNPKVVVATNVAQTSVTIPDIDVVVDTGDARITIEENGIQGLFLRDISQADIMQRKGRAGRTKNGEYILCSNVSIHDRQEFSVPEIQRSILDRVVLQLSAIGLDAEELEFFHQPDKEAILYAKKELNCIGATDADNKVTEIGYKMVKMPISVQFSRMIVEAEKYGVTESVIAIAAIIEVGGLLDRNGYYSEFTDEATSDLLAELDVWNKIIQIPRIDFEALNIKKKNFFKIKEQINRLHECLNGITEMSDRKNRSAILNSCLCGLVNHVYTRPSYDSHLYKGAENDFRCLDKRSCIKVYHLEDSDIIAGIPRNIEYETNNSIFGRKNTVELISFASIVSRQNVLKLCANEIVEKTEYKYSEEDDAICVTTKKIFRDIVVEEKSDIDYNHPEYANLKAEYEEEKDRTQNYFHSISRKKEKVVVIDDKEFEIMQDWRTLRYYIDIDAKTLFTTQKDRIVLKDGTRIWIRSSYYSYLSKGYTPLSRLSIKELSQVVEQKRVDILRKRRIDTLSQENVKSLDDVLKVSQNLGKQRLTMDNGGYGNNPIIVYASLLLKGDQITFVLSDDEEEAKNNTTEVLQYLFMNKIKKEYGDSKFSDKTGKKKKVLTDSERKVKEDFDSLVREVASSITLENANESLEFVEEYYQDLIASKM